MQGLKLSDGSTLDVSQASEQTKSAKELAPDFVDRRQQRNRLDRRRTRNPVFEARARRVGMALDRRQPRTGVIAHLSTKFGSESGIEHETDPAFLGQHNLGQRNAADFSVGKHRGWGPALIDLCASWWRTLRERRASAVKADATDLQSGRQAGNSN